MTARHVVTCDQCGTETQFQSFGMWIRIHMGGEILPESQADLCSHECLVNWLAEEATRRRKS